MLETLYKVENNLIDLLYKNIDNIKTMYIDYHKPYVNRIWFDDTENNCRVFLHKIEMCKESSEALYHPHKWNSAVRIISGEYEMGVGHSKTNELPVTDCKLILGAGACYEMMEKNGWHYVSPKTNVYSLMVTGNLNSREMPIEPNKKFRELTRNEIADIFYSFENYDKYNKRFSAQHISNLILDL